MSDEVGFGIKGEKHKKVICKIYEKLFVKQTNECR